MASKGKRNINVQDALDMIFADYDSENDQFDCGSNFEAAPDSGKGSQTEDSDLDESLLAETVVTSTVEQTISDTHVGEFYVLIFHKKTFVAMIKLVNKHFRKTQKM